MGFADRFIGDPASIGSRARQGDDRPLERLAGGKSDRHAAAHAGPRRALAETPGRGVGVTAMPVRAERSEVPSKWPVAPARRVDARIAAEQPASLETRTPGRGRIRVEPCGMSNAPAHTMYAPIAQPLEPCVLNRGANLPFARDAVGATRDSRQQPGGAGARVVRRGPLRQPDIIELSLAERRHVDATIVCKLRPRGSAMNKGLRCAHVHRGRTR